MRKLWQVPFSQYKPYFKVVYQDHRGLSDGANYVPDPRSAAALAL